MTLQPPAFSLLEIMLWTLEEGFFLLDRHLERLQRTGSYFSRSLDSEAIRCLLGEVTGCLSPVPHKIRLTLPAKHEPRVTVEPLSPLKNPYRIGLGTQPVDYGMTGEN